MTMMGEKLGINLLSNETEHGQKVRAALEFLIPYSSNLEKWPYEQIRGWEDDDSNALAIMLELSSRYFNEPKYIQILESNPPIDYSDHRINLYYPI